MRVFITGASGLIGRAIVDALLARGDEVVALSRSERRDGRPGITWVRGGVDDFQSWKASVDGCDAVLNFAGEVVFGRWTRGRMTRIVQSRVGITTALMHAIREASARPRLFVSASAIGYYGYGGEALLDESAPPGQGFLAELCREWEAAAMRVAELGVRTVILRMGVVLTREGGVLAALMRMFSAFLGGVAGSGRQPLSWIQRDDLVALVLRILDDPRFSGPINAVAPRPATNAELARAVGAAMQRPVWLDAPAFGLRLALGRMAEEAILSGQRVVSKRMDELGFTPRYPTLEAAVRAEVRA